MRMALLLLLLLFCCCLVLMLRVRAAPRATCRGADPRVSRVHCHQTPTVFVRSVSGQTLTERLFSSLSGGELFERITAEGYTMSEAEVINYMRQICEGVKHMHERNIIHLGKIIIPYKHYNVFYFYQLNFSSCSTCKISQVCSI